MELVLSVLLTSLVCSLVYGDVGVTSEGGVEAADTHVQLNAGSALAEVKSTAKFGLAGVAPGPSLVTPALIYGASVSADYLSTRYALSRGAREVNPLLQNGSLEAWKALQLAALVAVDVELQRRGHKGKARALRVLAVGVGVGLAVHNVSVARRQR